MEFLKVVPQEFLVEDLVSLLMILLQKDFADLADLMQMVFAQSAVQLKEHADASSTDLN
jgi:hypothetical protein